MEYSPERRRAFTLVELLVVIAISAVFSTLAITYSNIGRNEVALTVEAAKISQLILQAKQLSIATYTTTTASCGFGVELNTVSQTYSIFAYSPAGAPPCPPGYTITGVSSTDEQEYTPGTWQIPVSKGVVIQSQSDSLQTVLFYPPEPTVFLSSDGATFPSPAATLNVHLATVDGTNSITISINPEGQVSF